MTTAAEKAATPAPAETNTADKAPVDKRKALGRGLDSLLPAGPRAVTGPPADFSATIGDLQAQAARTPGEGLTQVPLEQIDTNPYQTRIEFDQEALEDLAESIRVNGVVQPIVVRPGKPGRYLLILGERRCRAAKLAGRQMIPAIVRRVPDQQAAEMTIVENLQRQDLNCMEQAAAFGKLSRDFGLTQDQIGQRVGMSRESVSNYMRLLKLPGTVMLYLQQGQLGFSEARMLLQFQDPAQIARLADEAVKKHLSVEQLEDLCMQEYVRKEEREKPGRARWVDPNVRAAQTEMERVLGVRVRIRDKKGKGKIVIEYVTLEDFDRVVEMLSKRNG